ncbi:MAG: choice-of-anchor D domain-containing protein [Myxococcales bacterium]|nr:choice-of-anchor D domain-containing protein [Myxococcales bacterium]
MRASRLVPTGAILLLLPTVACNCDDGDGLTVTAPKLEVAPASLDFGKVPVGGQPLRALTFRNAGNANLAISKVELISATGELLAASQAPEQLVPQAEFAFNVVYEPRDVGEDTATLTIFANDQEDPHVVDVRGEGVQGGAAVSHDGESCEGGEGLSFGAVRPGFMVSHTITVEAAGSAPVTVLSVVMAQGSSPEFTVEDPGASRVLQPGEQLTLTASYQPVDGGPDAGTVIITTDAPDAGSLRVPLCGQGVAPAVCGRPNPLDLGALAVGQTRAATLTLESCGGEAVTISAIALANDAQHMSAAGFSVTTVPALPVTLDPGQTTQVEVSFTAANLGGAQGWVEVQSDALNATTTWFPAIARGAMPCDLQVAPSTLNYTGVAAGSTQDKQVLVVNNGASDCVVDRIEVTSGAAVFTVTGPTAPVTVAAGGSTIVDVRYTPAGAGPDMGVLEIEEGGVPRTVDLVGNSDTADGCVLEPRPPFLNFGAVAPGTNRAMAVELVNVSSDPCFLRGVQLGAGSSTDFTDNSPNLGLILPTRSKQLAVTYAPSGPGTARGTLEIDTNDVVTGTFVVPLFATSAASNICVMPTDLPFGDVLGLTPMTFTIYACGANAVTVTGLDWTTPDPEFSLQSPPALPFTLQPGASQNVTVQYNPADNQGDTAIVTVRSDDAASPAIDVTATGGREVVPLEAGRYLYYWQIPNVLGGDIMRLPLQGATTPSPWWGPRTGKSCAGCHSVSPDGRYVAVIEGPSFRMVDTTTDIALALPNAAISPNYITWRPNVLAQPAYQYAYDDGFNISIASLWQGTLRELQGANDPNLVETMASWGPNGKIAFVRGTQGTNNQQGGGFGLTGPADLLIVDENGGTPVPVMGASTNLTSGSNYYPSFSPNGQWIAYTYSASGTGTLAAADARIQMVSAANNGTVLPMNTLNGNNGAHSYPTWSVDGRYLSFSSNRSGGAGDWDIYLAPIDPATGADGAAQNLTVANGPAFDHSAQWSP